MHRVDIKDLLKETGFETTVQHRKVLVLKRDLKIPYDGFFFGVTVVVPPKRTEKQRFWQTFAKSFVGFLESVQPFRRGHELPAKDNTKSNQVTVVNRTMFSEDLGFRWPIW